MMISNWRREIRSPLLRVPAVNLFTLLAPYLHMYSNNRFSLPSFLPSFTTSINEMRLTLYSDNINTICRQYSIMTLAMTWWHATRMAQSSMSSRNENKSMKIMTIINLWWPSLSSSKVKKITIFCFVYLFFRNRLLIEVTIYLDDVNVYVYSCH